MLIGADSEADRPGVRTDSMMLASIDTRTGDTILFGLPRNLERVPFPDYSPLKKLWPNGFRCPQDCLLNDVWMQGENNKQLYPGDPKPGVTALNEAVTGVTGLTPDYDILVNMASFTALVDAMGGVDITVRERVPIGGKVQNGQIVPGSIKGWIEPGASTSTAITPCGSRVAARRPTTSTACAGSAAWSARSSSRSIRR